jgi:hypothetical protein
MDPIEEVAKSIDYSNKPIKRIKKKTNTTINASSYGQQPVNLQKTPFLFFPPGKEMLFLGIYFAVLPYITGLLFVFFYIADGKAATFGSITISSDANFFLVWTIGYEILAGITLLFIAKSAIMFSLKKSKEDRRRSVKKIRRP